LAAELGISLKDVKGTGPGGAISAQDVLDASKGVAPAVGSAPEETPQTRMRRAIAAAMSRSKREIPHYYLGHTIDLEPALTWLSSENEKRSVEERLLPAVLLLKATALALREVPELNAFWENGRAVTKERIHVGAAIALRGGGLIAPALHDADKTGIGELMGRFRDLVQRVRSGKLRSSELTDATITVTSLGDQGVESLFGVIYPPQVAIVGFGTPSERPWVVDGKIAIRRTITATLSADHRVTDGHRGAQFLAVLEKLLQEPEELR
ncbi:MAG: dihydrolipoamide acetyltransferase family protein, partial [Bdellovibrionota bacterium]